MAETAQILGFLPRKKGKTFFSAPKGTRLFRVKRGKDAITRDVSGLPLPVWPDGGWSPEMAGFIHSLAEKNLSLADRGGTPGTYVSQLSHIVRFCHGKKIDFHNLKDGDFIDFIDELTAKTPDGERSRSDRSVVSIGRRTLSFLDFVGNRWHIPDFLSPDGAFIKAELRTYTKASDGRSPVVRQYWHHSCLPAKSPEDKRYPVPEDYINRLRKAVHGIKSSGFVKRRRLVLLRALDMTGGRRIELANLRVSDVLSAKAMERPFLKLLTFKRGGEPVPRLVPVSHSELDYLIEYIKFYRGPLVARRLGKEDNDFVFLNEKTGAPIKPNTITLELHLLRKAAGIEGKAHPHLFRHRYITLALFRLVRAYNVQNKDQFSELLAHMTRFAQEVMERTGHKSMSSLSRYVDWVFALSASVEGNPETVEVSELGRTGRASVSELEAMRDEMSDQEFAAEAFVRLKGLVRDISKVDGRRENQISESMLGKAVKNRPV
ncbi:tyrosine-type recombinase/integrase [Paraburkholderia metrosideri]|uniref:Tyrosine recombinase XerC n=1 Tax=Paraburkholderia metrosideri TaxID=580937 RepID=A0ABN7I1A6_9BURK|nr:tyrosine-type recombinase/integrase [Paraburkholderia metrosideri]CAD6542883.1 Tyrosine recombinase XerC [Paraburkholderia metrosideri]